MDDNKKQAQATYTKRMTLGILLATIVFLVFAIILLLAFKLAWVIPFLLLALFIVFGIINRKHPEMLAALRKEKKSLVDMPVAQSGDFRPPSSRRSYMMLVSLSHGSGQQITINSSPFIIGRAPDSDFCISDNYVSNRHLMIEYVPEEKLCYATDVSTNGSYLNSVRMQNNVKRPLHQGDTLQIAGLLFRVEYVHF